MNSFFVKNCVNLHFMKIVCKFSIHTYYENLDPTSVFYEKFEIYIL